MNVIPVVWPPSSPPWDHILHQRLPQSITGQLSKDTQQGRQQQMAAHLFTKKSRKQIQALYHCQAHILHTLTYRHFSRGQNTKWGCQIQSHLVSTWLDLMSYTILWQDFFKYLQHHAGTAILTAQTAAQLSVMLKERIILCHSSLYWAPITVSTCSRSLYHQTWMEMEMICLKDFICECVSWCQKG